MTREDLLKDEWVKENFGDAWVESLSDDKEE